MAFRSIVPKIPGELGEWPGAPQGIRREAALGAGPLLRPERGETSETGLFFLGPFYPPLLSRFLLKYLVLPNLAINMMLHKDVSGTLVLRPLV